jgi:hypothetical protein
MPLLSYDVAPAKGATRTASMDKATLLALAPVVADAYWADGDNTQTVIVTFKSTTGSQKRVLIFDFSQATPTAALAFPARCRNNFTISKIVMLDYLGDKLSIPSPGLSGDNLSLV